MPDPLAPAAPWLSPARAWAQAKDGDAQLVDVDKSLAFRKRHASGARFIAPDRLGEFLRKEDGRVIVLSGDGVLAQRVASELVRQGFDAAAVLGGTRAWIEAGLPTASGDEGNLTGEDDAWYGGYNYTDTSARNASFREYLSWELGLPAQTGKKGSRTPFRRLALPT
jgi:rhodanese-related sulfurtransferase